MISPSVTIVIATYNRRVKLEETLRHCSELQPRPDEIIVVDDASTDGTQAFLSSLAEPRPAYIRMPENRGQACARNAGFAAAHGEIVVSLDDDAYLLDSDALARIAQRFEAFPECGILTFRVFTPRQDDGVKPAEHRLFYEAEHMEGACAYRRRLLETVGAYLPFVHSGGEGTDLSLRTLDAGYTILRDYSIRVFHDFDPPQRGSDWQRRVRRMTTRNDLLTVWLRFPWRWVLPATVHKSFSQCRFGLRYGGGLGASLLGVGEFLVQLPFRMKHRKPVNIGTLRRYLALRRQAEELPAAKGP